MLDAVSCQGSQDHQFDSSGSFPSGSENDFQFDHARSQSPPGGAGGASPDNSGATPSPSSWGGGEEMPNWSGGGFPAGSSSGPAGGSGGWAGGSSGPSGGSFGPGAGSSGSTGGSFGSADDSSEAAPQLTGNLDQDKQTLAQMVAGGANPDALQTFAEGVSAEAADAGDTQDSVAAMNIASSIGNGSYDQQGPEAVLPSTGSSASPSLPGAADPSGSGAPAGFGSGTPDASGAGAPTSSGASSSPSEAGYQSDEKQADALFDKVGQEFGAADADTDPSTQAASFKQAEQDAEADSSLYEKAAGEATNDSEKNSALYGAARSGSDAARLIFNSGQAGPGAAQHGEYDTLMGKAQSEYSSIPNNPQAAQRAADLATEKSEADVGHGNSSVYQNADHDLTSSPSAPNASSPPPASGSSPPAASGAGTPSASFPNGNESSFQSDMKTANDKANQAQSELEEAEKTPVALNGDGGYVQAKQDFEAAHDAAQKAALDATNEGEKTYAASKAGATDAQAANAIWMDGQAGPGHSGSGEYDNLMQNAQVDYKSIEDDAAASSADKNNASKHADDLNTMKTSTDEGHSSKSSDYSNAANDFQSTNVMDAPRTGT
jgi:hypothetical protein